METEERTRNAEMLENIQTQVKAIAETCGSLVGTCGSLVQRQDKAIEWLRKLDDGQRRLEDGQHKLEDGQHKLEDGLRRLEGRHDRLEGRHDILLGRVDQMEIRFELKFSTLEAFAGDTQQRLKRIEAHLQAGGSNHSIHASPRRKATRDESSKRGKKS